MKNHLDKRRLLFFTDLIVAMILFVFVVCASLIGLNLFKPQIESAFSQALGMPVTIGGTIEMDILPRPALTVTQLEVKGREAVPLSVAQMTIALSMRKLLRGNIHVQEFTLVKPRAYLFTDPAGRFRFAPPAAEGSQRTSPPAPPSIPAVDRFAVTGGEFAYGDARNGRTVKLDGLNMELHSIAISVPGSITAHQGSLAADVAVRTHTGSSEIILSRLKITVQDIVVRLHSVPGTPTGAVTAKDVSFGASVSAASLRAADIVASPFAFTAQAQDGMFVARSRSFGVFGGSGSGRVVVNLRGPVPDVALEAALSGFNVEEFFASLNQKKRMEGRMDLSVDFRAAGADRASLVRSLTGTFMLTGGNLTLHMIDLDALLREIRKSQTFSLVDIGAYFFAGPLGTALTQGFDFAGVYWKAGDGTTSINNIISRWTLEQGMARAEDVAIATARNRVAVTGALDFLRREYSQVTVAVLDRKGCAVLSQPINGPFGKPRLGTVSIVKSLVGPVLGVLQKTKNIVLLDQCTPFYSGSLQHPE